MLIREFMNRHHREGNRAARRNKARIDYRLCNGAAIDQNRAATAANIQRVVRPAKLITVPKLAPVAAPVDDADAKAKAAKDRRNAAARSRRANAKLGDKLAEAA